MKVYLRALEPGDHVLIHTWRNDEETSSALLGNKYFVSLERERRWVEEKIANDKDSIVLAICLRSSNEMIGYLHVFAIDYRNRVAQWGGIIIAADQRRKGYSKEACLLMLQYVFDELNMNRFYGIWLDENIASLKMGMDVGFQREGLMRKVVFRGGKYHDGVIMSVLKEEWVEIKNKHGL